MAASLIIEEESGTYDRTPHAHNGYFAGDFTDQPMLTNTQLAALTALPGRPVRHRRGPRRATLHRLRPHPIGEPSASRPRWLSAGRRTGWPDYARYAWQQSAGAGGIGTGAALIRATAARLEWTIPTRRAKGPDSAFSPDGVPAAHARSSRRWLSRGVRARGPRGSRGAVAAAAMVP